MEAATGPKETIASPNVALASASVTAPSSTAADKLSKNANTWRISLETL